MIDKDRECLLCGRRDDGVFLDKFCSRSCEAIYRWRVRCGFFVRKA